MKNKYFQACVYHASVRKSFFLNSLSNACREILTSEGYEDIDMRALFAIEKGLAIFREQQGTETMGGIIYEAATLANSSLIQTPIDSAAMLTSNGNDEREMTMGQPLNIALKSMLLEGGNWKEEDIPAKMQKIMSFAAKYGDDLAQRVLTGIIKTEPNDNSEENTARQVEYSGLLETFMSQNVAKETN